MDSPHPLIRTKQYLRVTQEEQIALMQEAHEERMRTPGAVVAFLKHAGILDENGNVAERYKHVIVPIDAAGESESTDSSQ